MSYNENLGAGCWTRRFKMWFCMKILYWVQFIDMYKSKIYKEEIYFPTLISAIVIVWALVILLHIIVEDQRNFHGQPLESRLGAKQRRTRWTSINPNVLSCLSFLLIFIVNCIIRFFVITFKKLYAIRISFGSD